MSPLAPRKATRIHLPVQARIIHGPGILYARSHINPKRKRGHVIARPSLARGVGKGL